MYICLDICFLILFIYFYFLTTAWCSMQNKYQNQVIGLRDANQRSFALSNYQNFHIFHLKSLQCFLIIRLVWLSFVIFTFLHLFANYQAVSCVVMETLNMNRLYIVLKHYYKHQKKILSPKEVNHLDPILGSG